MEATDTPVERFVQLFKGRGDAYGTWEGGCKKEPLTREKFAGHLTGEELIGVYPLVPLEGRNNEWFCVWGCSDIDVDDLDAARNLQTALSLKNVTSWVEKTRKGYHVWVFATEPVKAGIMRNALLAAHQAIGYPAKEVNPKQTIPGEGFGNYVRLPYPNGAEHLPENRYIVDIDESVLDFHAFVEAAYQNRNTPELLEAVASLYTPPARRMVIVDRGVSADLRHVLKKLNGLAFMLWRDGPKEGKDRSSVLFRLGVQCRYSGLSPEEAYAVVASADERWGKFHLRPNGDKEIISLIERSYAVS